jgi:acetyl-CoA synthase
MTGDKPNQEESKQKTVDSALEQMLSKSVKDDVETIWNRYEKMLPQCGFGELGVCCRICLQGPCQINPFGQEPKKGVCGATDYTIVARNLIRMMAAGCAAHSDHGRHLVHVLRSVGEGHAPDYTIKDKSKLVNVAKRLGIPTEGKSVSELAKDVATTALFDYSNQEDISCGWLRGMLPQNRLDLLESHDVIPTNIDKSICEVMHRTNMGCDADPVPLLFGGIKCAISDITGQHISTDVSDILFGTPKIIKSEANLGVLKKDYVNIIVHGHNPILSEVICDAAKELESEAISAGAKGINIAGICCTSNELLMRRGIPLATNYLGQEFAITTGVVDAMVIDYQCIAPSVSIIAQCYHTKLISTMPTTRIPTDYHIEFDERIALSNAKQIIRIAIDAFKHRDETKIEIPEIKNEVIAGFSLEQIKQILSHFSDDPIQYLADKIKDGTIRGIGLIAGCNNVKTVQDEGHLTIAKELVKNNILVVATGCASGAYAKHGLLTPDAVDTYAGESLKTFLKECGEKVGLKSLPLVLHMGSCVDNSRVEDLVSELAQKIGVDIKDLPIVASAPEAMSEKAVAIGTWLVATGWPTHVGIIPYIYGSPLVTEVATHTAKDVYGGHFIFEPDSKKAVQQLLNVIKYRRWKLGFDPDPTDVYCYGNVQTDKKYTKEELYKMAIDGAIIATGYAEVLLNRAIKKYGADKPIHYPDTGYGLPCIDAWTGVDVKKLGDLPQLLGSVRARIREEYTFENAKAAGEAVLYSAEIVEILKYIDNENPYNYPEKPYCGFVGDPILRKLGIAFVDDTIPGAVVFVGKARDPKALARMVRDCQDKGMLIIASFDIIKQLQDEGIAMGLDIMLYPVGEFTQVIHGANFATRAALAFGGVKKGDRTGLYNYLKNRPKVFVIQLGPLDHIKVAAEFGVIFMGSPTITDQDVEEIVDPDDPSRVLYTSEKDYDKIIQKAIEIRGCRIKLKKVPIPTGYGPAFEGESIRKAEMYCDIGGRKSVAFEYLRMREEHEVDDGKIVFIGKDVDEFPEGSAIPLGIIVDIYGRKMQKDFESVLERRIHQFMNFAQGMMHLGQRDLIWVRLSKSGVKNGLRLKHIGEILHAKFHDEFEGLVNRVQVTIITDETELKKYLPEARKAYEERDARLRGLTDESVDTFYSCTLCQSFAPNHVCIISAERLGLCGAINWLDAKAAYEIAPAGPNRPWKKGKVIDETNGIWEGINEAARELSRGKVEQVSIYSILAAPMTSCGCFECIIAIVPEANGVLIVNREYGGMTPVGMKFSTLAGTVGGGNQMPGFLGIGRQFIVSKKFISADGGFRRIVWMPKMLKDEMRDKLIERATELGDPDFIDKIADETVATTAEELLQFLEKVQHPALKMSPMM